MLLPLAVTAQTYSLVVGVDGLGPYGIDAAATPYIDSPADGSWGGPGYRGRSRCKPTPALTTRGMGGDEMQQISQWILRSLKHTDDAGVVETTRREVAELAEQFPVPAARLQAGAEAVA